MPLTADPTSVGAGASPIPSVAAPTTEPDTPPMEKSAWNADMIGRSYSRSTSTAWVTDLHADDGAGGECQQQGAERGVADADLGFDRGDVDHPHPEEEAIDPEDAEHPCASPAVSDFVDDSTPYITHKWAIRFAGSVSMAPTLARNFEPCSPSMTRWSNVRLSVATSRTATSPS